jgi:uncharacterized RmlC-like cupin family protein
MPEPVGHLYDPRKGEKLDVLGPTIQYVTTPDADDRDPCVMRGTIPPGVVVPLHSHADPETFIVLSGRLEGLATAREGVTWIPVGPGDIFHVPGNAKHAWRNPSREPAVTIIASTAKMGRFFRELGIPIGPANTTARPPSDATFQRFLETAERYGYWNATPEENAAVDIVLPPERGLAEGISS